MNRSHWSVRLTGTQVASWPAFWVLLPYFAVSIFLANDDLAGASAPVLVSVAIAVQCFLFGLLLAFRAAAVRWPALNASWWRVVIALVAISTVRALALAQALNALGLTESIDWTRRLVVSIPWVATALIVTDLAIGAVRRHRQRVDALLARQAQGRQALAAAMEAIEAQREEVAETVRAELVDRVSRIAVDDPAGALASLSATAEDVVRPLSRQLVDSSPPIEPVAAVEGRQPFDLRAFIDDATRGQPLSPGWVVVLGAAFAAPLLFATLPWREAIVLTVTGLALVWLTMTVSNTVLGWACPRVSLGIRLVLLGSVLLLSALVMGASGLALVDASDDITRRIVATEVLIPITVAVALACARAVRIQDETIESRLEQASRDLTWAVARANGIRWREQRALARAMHGPVQGAIATAAARLERAIRAGRADAALVDEVRHQVIDACERIVDDGSHRRTTAASALADLAATWRGVCDITWEIADDAGSALDADPIADFAVRELACEASWNALRHARPSTVCIRVTMTEPQVAHITVVDDGHRHDATDAAAVAAPDAGRPGLGSRMLDDMSLTWRRSSGVAATTVTIDVPVLDRTGAAEGRTSEPAPTPPGGSVGHIQGTRDPAQAFPRT